MNYLDRIRALPCLACGRVPCQAAHVRFSDGLVGKVNPGIGKKPEDKWVVPLCVDCHTDQHKHGERVWWEEQRIDVIAVCQALWKCKAEYRPACKIIRYA